jgi:hypothetical protein
VLGGGDREVLRGDLVLRLDEGLSYDNGRRLLVSGLDRAEVLQISGSEQRRFPR